MGINANTLELTYRLDPQQMGKMRYQEQIMRQMTDAMMKKLDYETNPSLVLDKQITKVSVHPDGTIKSTDIPYEDFYKTREDAVRPKVCLNLINGGYE